MLTAVLFLAFGGLLVIGVPIAFSLSISSVLAVFLVGDIPVDVLIQRLFRSINSFVLLAIPFFVFSGNIMARGGVSKKLTDIAAAAVGRMTGGLAQVSTVGCALFSTVSGSATATASAVGSVMIGQMEERGYDKTFSASCVASSGTIGLILPPSVNMVLYGALAGASIGRMFMGGILPGIIMVCAIMMVNYILCRKIGYKGEESFKLTRLLNALKNGIWALFMPLIILGGIYGGIFTPTEAAGVAVFYGLAVSVFVYRQLKWKQFKEVLYNSAIGTATVMFLMANSALFSYILVIEQVPQRFAAFIVGVSDSMLVVQLLMMLALLIVGLFLDNAVSVVLITPIFAPVIAMMGGNLEYFGVLLVFALAIGQITPPTGMTLFVVSTMAKVPIEPLYRKCVPYVIGLLIVLLLLNLFPPIVTFIPSLANI